MFRSVREFVGALDAAGELRRVRDRVDPILEIAAIADRASKSPAPILPSASARANDPRFHHLGGQALLFENVEGSDVPVLINAYGSYRRMEMALGCAQGGFDALAARLGDLVKPEPPRSLREALGKLRQFAPLLRIPPKRRARAGICQQVVLTGDQIDLRRWPLIRCWPLDGDFAALGYPANTNEGIPGIESGPDWSARFRGRYITLAGIHTIHADDLGDPKPRSHNIGMYRVQMLGPHHMAMHWHMHHDGARHWRSWKARGQRMPVAIVLGGESVLPYAATAPLPPGMSELLLAGYLNGRGGGIEMCPCKTVPLHVPANAEIVIEGYVSHEAGMPGWDPRGGGDVRRQASDVSQDRSHASGVPTDVSRLTSHVSPGPGAVFEGPFGDHTGFYSLPDRYPILEITAITHRRDPIYPTTVVGLPPQEDYFLGKATERLFLPLLKVLIPDIEDYDLPMFGAFHNCAVVKVKKHYPLHARRVMHSIWGAGQMAWTKTIVVVDDDVNVHDTAAVLRAVGEQCVPARDTELVRGPLDILDHAAPFLGAGGKLGLDATRKVGEAETHRALSPIAAEACALGPIEPVLGAAARAAEQHLRTLPSVLDARVPDELGGWWLLLKLDKCSAGEGAAMVKTLGGLTLAIALPRWIVLVGPDATLDPFDDALFHWLAHAAPDRDRFMSVCGRRVAFDATPKMPGDEREGLPVRHWPPVLSMPAAVVARVKAVIP